MCVHASCSLLCVCVCTHASAHVSHSPGAQDEDHHWVGYIRTGIGRAMGQRQVGASSPGPCTEVLLALATVGARGVVFTLALQTALAHCAQVGMQVAFAPEETRGCGRSGSSRVSHLASGEGKNSGAGVSRTVLGRPGRDSGGQTLLQDKEGRCPLPWVGYLFQPGACWTS